MRKAYIGKDVIESIYIGGGTPSLLSQADLIRIFDALDKHFTLGKDPEITLEVNPDDINKSFVLGALSDKFTSMEDLKKYCDNQEKNTRYFPGDKDSMKAIILLLAVQEWYKKKKEKKRKQNNKFPSRS